jgi:hypothetical protein
MVARSFKTCPWVVFLSATVTQAEEPIPLVRPEAIWFAGGSDHFAHVVDGVETGPQGWSVAPKPGIATRVPGLPQTGVLLHDIPDHEDSHQRAVAEVILAQIQSSQPFNFHYHGVSDPCGHPAVLLDYRNYYQFSTDDPMEYP